MDQWIAILVVLVCLSDSTLSRTWVSFDYNDDYELALDDTDEEPNWKSKRGSDSWESDEDDDEPGYGNDQPTSTAGHEGHHHNHEYDHRGGNDHNEHGYQHHHHGFTHNYEYNHQGHGRNDNKNNLGTPDIHGHPGHPSKGLDPSYQNKYHVHNPHCEHPTHAGYPGHKFGPRGYSSHNGYPDQNTGSPGHSSHTGPHRHPTQAGIPSKPAIDAGSAVRGLPQNYPNKPGSGNDIDRVVFPDFNNQATGSPPSSTARPAVTIPPTTPIANTTDRPLLGLVTCIRNCPVTAEYNPVCGSNNITYNNPGTLECTRNCGLNVTVARRGPCPRPVPRLSSTLSPITNSPPAVTTIKLVQTTTTKVMPAVTFSTIKPTRFTNIDVSPANTNKNVIPLDVLQSVFGTPAPNLVLRKFRN